MLNRTSLRSCRSLTKDDHRSSWSSSDNRRMPAVPLTNKDVWLCRWSGTIAAALLKSSVNISLAAEGFPTKDDSPTRSLPQEKLFSTLSFPSSISNLNTKARVPVEPASITTAYCSSWSTLLPVPRRRRAATHAMKKKRNLSIV